MTSARGGVVAVKPGVPAVFLSAHVRDEQLAEAVLIPDPSRPRKAVRGARTAGGERTWLRRQETNTGGRPLPGSATVHVACNGRSFEFQLEQGAFAPACQRLLSPGPLTRRRPVTSFLSASARPSAGVHRKPVASGLEFELGRCAACATEARGRRAPALSLIFSSLLQCGFVVQLRFREVTAGVYHARAAFDWLRALTVLVGSGREQHHSP